MHFEKDDEFLKIIIKLFMNLFYNTEFLVLLSGVFQTTKKIERNIINVCFVVFFQK